VQLPFVLDGQLFGPIRSSGFGEVPDTRGVMMQFVCAPGQKLDTAGVFFIMSKCVCPPTPHGEHRNG
jgi:hypothetical protein